MATEGFYPDLDIFTYDSTSQEQFQEPFYNRMRLFTETFTHPQVMTRIHADDESSECSSAPSTSSTRQSKRRKTNPTTSAASTASFQLGGSGAWTFSDKEVTFIGRLQTDLSSCSKPWVNNLQFKIELKKNDPAWYMQHWTDNAVLKKKPYRLKLIDAKIHVPVVQLNPGVMQGIRNRWDNEEMPLLYHMRKVLMDDYVLPARRSSHYINFNFPRNTLPTKMSCAIIEEKAFNGTYDSNPYESTRRYIDSANGNTWITSIKLKIGGHEIGSLDEIAADEETDVGGYMRQIVYGGRFGCQTSNGITMKEFSTGGYYLPTWSICAGGVDFGRNAYYSPLGIVGKLSLEIEYNKQTDETFRLVCLCEYPQTIEVTKGRKVISSIVP